MIVCGQCNGKGACVGTNEIQDVNANSESYKMTGTAPAANPCSQCNGKGYMTGGSF